MTSNRRVLILTYYWPPAGGPGVQRVLKFAKYLPEFGWEPIILTVENGEYPSVDYSLTSDIPQNCQVFKTKTVEFFNLFKILSGRSKDKPIETYILNRRNISLTDRFFTWIRVNLFLPDARVGWVPFALFRGMDVINTLKPDVIFSCSPPHSLHLTAYLLKKIKHTPWVADFRDPWTEAFWYQDVSRTSWAKKINLWMEQKVVQHADSLITVSRGFRDLLLKSPRPETHILPNGFDGDDFVFKKKRNQVFTITYAGNISASQNPRLFFKALRRIFDSFPDRLCVQFFGNIDDTVYRSLQEEGLIPFVQIGPYLPHNEIISKITQSDLLLLLIPIVHGEGVLTGKVYEYIATHNFILAIGDEHHEVAELLSECRCGTICGYDKDPFDILVQKMDDWENGIEEEVNIEAIHAHERKSLTAELANILNAYASK